MAHFHWLVCFFFFKHFRSEMPRGYCVCLLSLCRTEGTILTTSQRTACVAQTCRDPFRHQYLDRSSTVETSVMQYGSVWVTPTFGGGNTTRAAPLQTEPTRTLHWKCTISFIIFHGLLIGSSVNNCCFRQGRSWETTFVNVSL